MRKSYSTATSVTALALILYTLFQELGELLTPIGPTSATEVFVDYIFLNIPSLIAIPLSVHQLFKPTKWIHALLVVFILYISFFYFVLLPYLAAW